MSAPKVDALLFDVFGTVVDWRGSIARELAALGQAHGHDADWDQFAREWHADGYQAGIARIRTGEAPWTAVAEIHRAKLTELLPSYGLSKLQPAEVNHLNRVWRRLDPWPDSATGLARLKRTFVIAPLSNGDFGMLVDLARYAQLDWDCVLTADLFGRFKPDPATYQGAIRLLDLPPERVMLVAAHVYDLRAAQAQGLRTAYVPRPEEHGPGRSLEPNESQASFDLVAPDLIGLAERLGA